MDAEGMGAEIEGDRGFLKEHESSEVQKDLTLLFSAAWGEGRSFVFMDGMAGRGVRAWRIAEQVPGVKGLILNDSDPKASRDISQGISERTRLFESRGIQVVHLEEEITAALVRIRREGIGEPRLLPDLVDLDPFGSAWQVLPAALSALSLKGGVLSVTVLDLNALSPSGPGGLCWARYNSMIGSTTSTKTQPKLLNLEIGLRVCLASIIRMSASILYPSRTNVLFAGHCGSCIRLFVQVPASSPCPDTMVLVEASGVAENGFNDSSVEPSADSETVKKGGDELNILRKEDAESNASHAEGKEGKKRGGGLTVSYCWKCMGCPAFELLDSLANPQVLHTTCPHCAAQRHLLGPLYTGPLVDPVLVDRMSSALQAGKVEISERSRVESLMKDVARELSAMDAIFFYDIPSLAHFFNLDPSHPRVPKRRHMEKELMKAGYKVSDSHLGPYQVLKTDATSGEILGLFGRLAGVNTVEWMAKKKAFNDLNRPHASNPLKEKSRATGLQVPTVSESQTSNTARAMKRTFGDVDTTQRSENEDIKDLSTQGAEAPKTLNRRERRRLKFQQSTREEAESHADSGQQSSAVSGVLSPGDPPCDAAGTEFPAAQKPGSTKYPNPDVSGGLEDWSASEFRKLILQAAPGSTVDLSGLIKQMEADSISAGSHFSSEPLCFNLVKPLEIRKSLILTASHHDTQHLSQSTLRSPIVPQGQDQDSTTCSHNGDAASQPPGTAGAELLKLKDIKKLCPGVWLRAKRSDCLVVKGREVELRVRGVGIQACGGTAVSCHEGRIELHRCRVEVGLDDGHDGGSFKQSKRKASEKSLPGGRMACHAVLACHKARMLMEECEVVGCSLPSVLLSGTSEAEILRCRVSNHGGAAGMHIRSGSTARVVESEVSNCGKAGIFINGAGASAEVEKCHLSKNKFASLEISHSARARVDQCVFESGERGGVFVHSNGRCHLENSQFLFHRMAQVHVTWGGYSKVLNCDIRNGHQAGILQGEGALVEEEGCSFSSNKGGDFVTQ